MKNPNICIKTIKICEKIFAKGVDTSYICIIIAYVFTKSTGNEPVKYLEVIMKKRLHCYWFS